MSFTTVLVQIKAILDGVTGIANVYDYPKYSGDWTTLNSLFVSNSKFHFWEIYRTSALSGQSTGEPGGLGSQIFRDHVFLLDGYYGVDNANASEKVFQALCDTIMDTYNSVTNRALGGTADLQIPAELVSFENLRYPPGRDVVLCHKAQIRIQASEEVTC